LFVSRIMQKLSKPIFAKFGGMVAHEPRKTLLDSDRNLDHAKLGLVSGYLV